VNRAERREERFQEDLEVIEHDRGGVEFDDDVVDVLRELKPKDLLTLAKAFRESFELGRKAAREEGE